MRKRIHNFFEKIGLTLFFAIIFFLMLCFVLLLSLVIIFSLDYLNLINIRSTNIRFPVLFYFIVASLIIGSIISYIASRQSVYPLQKVIDAANKIADGDYSVRISFFFPRPLKNLSESFNHMAEELGSVEILTNDFINNFSHEFKTPIASIEGFAKILKDDSLSKEQRDEYLDIIINESKRLTELSTNVLYLSKLEEQSILTDKTTYDVTEQIRIVIALLDEKWSSKDIDMNFDGDEAEIIGNKEMMQQVWINLLDNAIKFSPQGGKIFIEVNDNDDQVEFLFKNQCETMDEESLKRIFDKFYQGDSSHTTKGNGLGLSIAKEIIELHNGEISVYQQEGYIIFKITI